MSVISPLLICSVILSSTDELIRHLQPDLGALGPQDYRDVMLGREVEQASDSGLQSLALYRRLAAKEGIDSGLRAFYLAKTAARNIGVGQPHQAVETLQELKALAGAESFVACLADLEIAGLMTWQGGNIPEFSPTFEEIQGQYEHIFATYSPFDYRMVEAHLVFARKAWTLAVNDPAMRHLVHTSVRHVVEAREIVRAVIAYPELIEDDFLRDRLIRFGDRIDGQIWSMDYFVRGWIRFLEDDEQQTLTLPELEGIRSRLWEF